MAKLIDKPSYSGTDRTLVLEAREGLVYPLPFDDWNVIRVGGFISATNPTNDNQDIMVGGSRNQTIAIATIRDKILMGLIRGNGSNFPSETSTPFVGWYSGNSNVMAGGASIADINANQFPGSLTFGANFTGDHMNTGTIHGNGVVVPSTSPYAAAWGIGNPPANAMGSSTSYSWYWGMLLQVLNKGQSNQQIWIKSQFAATNNTNCSNVDIQSALIGATYTDYGVADWAIGGVPYQLPNSFLLYWPFTMIRQRVHNIGVIKQS